MPNSKIPGLLPGLLLYVVIADIVVMILAIASRALFDLAPIKAFYPFFYGVQVALLLALLAMLQLGYSLLKKKPGIRKPAMMAAILGIAPLLVSLATVGVSGFKAPMIHDITTDMENPPQFGILSAMRSAEENSLDYAGDEVANQQKDFYPDVKALRTDMSRDLAFRTALQTARDMGWQMAVEDEASGMIEASDKSKIFGFVDDVVIRVKSEAGGSRIDLRSVSRVGKSDLGVNAERIIKFCEMFQQRMPAQGS